VEQQAIVSVTNSGQSLKNLCRIAGASFMVAGGFYVWAFVAEFLLPAPGFGEGLLQYVASNRSSYVASYALFTAANSLSIVGVLGIYAATRALDRSYAMLGAGTMIIGLMGTLFSSTAPALISLSDGFSAATSDAERQAFVTAAGAVSSMNNPLVASVFIGVGVVFVSLAMRKAPFGRGLAYLGVVVGAHNILRALPFFAAYPFTMGVIFVSVSSVWILGVGYRLYRLAHVSSMLTS
jgi:hypothetical protein